MDIAFDAAQDVALCGKMQALFCDKVKNLVKLVKVWSRCANVKGLSSFALAIMCVALHKEREEEKLGDLFVSFFRFYGKEFDFNRLCIDLENGFMEKNKDDEIGALFIRDPIEASKNMGSAVDFGELRTQMMETLDTLSKKKNHALCHAFKGIKMRRRT